MILHIQRRSEFYTLQYDDADDTFVRSQRWYISSRGYVRNRKGQNFHRLLLNPPKGLVIDHINHNALDNRRSNLRICTQAQNTWNRTVNKKNKSGHRGVHWYPKGKKWRAHLDINHNRIYLGSFNTINEAAKVYRETARKIYGEFYQS